MPELSSLSDLQDLRGRLQEDIDESKPCIVVAAGTACLASGADDIQRMIKRYLIEHGLVERVRLRITGDLGFCVMAPYVIVEPQMAFYCHVTTDDVPKIIEAALSGTYVEELLYRDPSTGKVYHHQDEIPFFAKQKRSLLGKNQGIDPVRLFNYIVNGGYSALERVLQQPDQERVLGEVKRSKIRGRGGAGFPTGTKWELTAKQDGSRGKYLVCNADEGDPGAYMDRGILEGNPHSVIEGMIIGAIATGATEGFIFVRHEYPLAIKHTLIALRQAREYGVLDKDILGSGIDFDINIVQSAGAFVCGEETALIKTIEGYMGEPRQRPPYPIERGIFGRPTCINNVETWSNIPLIINQGGETFAATGTDKSTGTKVFSVVGKIRNTGLVEVPMGISIKEIVHDIGGGPLEGGKIKAVQIGGPSGGCIPASRFDLPIDYDSLTEAGAIMGSGGMIAMDENTCMVDVAKYFMGFLKDESCGKCFTCRKGTQRLYEILDDITRGKGTMRHLDLLEELARVVKDTTMCGLGQSAPNPVLSTLRYFRDEYERHIKDRRCDAFVCKDLVGAPCQSACPVGTEAWRYVAHIERGEYEEAYLAIRQHNPFPSVCARVCDHKCESRCRLGTSGSDPVAIRALKRFVTDRVDPSVFKPERRLQDGAADKRVAVVGSGPAGLTAAHELSLMGYKVVVYEAAAKPGGMLVSGVPSYRLPRVVLEREIDALLDDNITLRCNKALGKEITVDGLLADGHHAVFLALGAHQSHSMGIEGEDSEGVVPSMGFLKAWNHDGKNLAKGRVGVIGGGNSAIDAARVALRQQGVDKVTILYRRTRKEMPAFETEIEEALHEGIELSTLVSPSRVIAEGGCLKGLEVIDNDLGEVDASGRRRPVPREGSNHVIELDTMIVAIGERPGTASLEGVDVQRWGGITADPQTLATGREGVFAGGDVVTGPNTVIDAIAAGQRAAQMIDQYLRDEELVPRVPAHLPEVHVAKDSEDVSDGHDRVTPPTASMESRCSGFDEVELVMTEEAARQEAGRCLRCDLEFTQPAQNNLQQAEGGRA